MHIVKKVKYGETYEECKFADEALYWSAYFVGHTKDGMLMDFFAHGFVETNEQGLITRWETHVIPEYNDFLDVAIGVHGPFKNGPMYGSSC